VRPQGEQVQATIFGQTTPLAVPGEPTSRRWRVTESTAFARDPTADLTLSPDGPTVAMAGHGQGCDDQLAFHVRALLNRLLLALAAAAVS
jgi:hypothetical protein